MKPLRTLALAAAVLSASLAQATIIATVDSAEGFIALTDRPCSPRGSGLVAYNTSHQAPFPEGCWVALPDEIVVVWPDKSLGHYPRKAFEFAVGGAQALITLGASE